MYKKVLLPEQIAANVGGDGRSCNMVPKARNLCDGPLTGMKGEKLAWLGNGERAGLGNGKVGTHEQISEVLQHVAKIPRERIEAIERGIQGDLTCVPTKIRATGMDSPKATQDVKDGGNSEDSQRMDGFVGRCRLKGSELGSQGRKMPGQENGQGRARTSNRSGEAGAGMHEQQMSEVLQHAVQSWGQGNGEAGAGTHEQMSEVLQHATKAHMSGSKRSKKSGQESGEAGVGTYEQMLEVLQHAAHCQPGQEENDETGAGTHMLPKARVSELIQSKRSKKSELGSQGRKMVRGTHEQSEQMSEMSEVLQHVAKARSKVWERLLPAPTIFQVPTGNAMRRPVTWLQWPISLQYRT
ncbi:hypothetical protein EDB84DRAFT_1444375 [Lactarius hengduanensis]|nr:hypothetical protein EDB84DRAFT_1444375 [Lactarius hengduanensis]